MRQQQFDLSREDFDRLHPRLVSRFRSLGASTEEARDLAQEVFVQVCSSIDSFRGRSQLETWIFGIARRVWSSHFRAGRTQKRRVESISLDSNPEPRNVALPGADPENQIVDRDLTRRALRELSEELRSPFVLSLNGWKYREIAERLEVSENQVASLIFRARNQLRANFRSGG